MGAMTEQAACHIAIPTEHAQPRRITILPEPAIEVGAAAHARLPAMGITPTVDVIEREKCEFLFAATGTSSSPVRFACKSLQFLSVVGDAIFHALRVPSVVSVQLLSHAGLDDRIASPLAVILRAAFAAVAVAVETAGRVLALATGADHTTALNCNHHQKLQLSMSAR
jgi:hypothetical protein